MIESIIAKKIGIQYPIIQGAMAWVADAELAAAVSNAGGLGIIAAGTAPADYAREQIQKAKTLTNKPFGVNIMLMSPFADDVARVACEEKVKVVTTGAGSPSKYMDDFRAAGIIVIPVVASVALAKRMERAGADAVVAEGMESGGHIGKQTTMALVPQVVDALSIPVIAAGGIADGRGVGAALMLGADAVQVGTRFLTAFECNVHENYKKSVLAAKDLDTTITGQITGHPVRVLKTKFAKKLLDFEAEQMKAETPDVEGFNKLGTGALRRAVVEGDMDNGSAMSGQIAGLVNKEESCEAIVAELVSGCEAVLKKVSGRIGE